MARIFNNFENIPMGDFTPFTEGYHLVTITGHKEDKKTNAKGETREIDVFELMADSGATTNLTLYYLESTQWTYKKLMAVCGAKVEDMKGTQTLDFKKLIGKRFGAYVTLEESTSWDEKKMQNVVKRYPRMDMTKVYTEQKAMELMESFVPTPKAEPIKPINNFDGMTPIDDGDIPF